MVLLLTATGFSNYQSKMGDHTHHQPHPDPDAVLEALQAEVSGGLERLVPGSNPDVQFPSLCWAKQCLGVLQLMNGALAKLGVKMNLSVSGWESDFVEGYLTYSFNLLELLNSISVSLSHLSQSRLSLSHALTLLESSPPCAAAEHLAPILPRQVQVKDLETDGERVSHGNEPVSQRALRLMEGVGYWVCGIILSALSGEQKAFLETRKWGIGSENPSLVGLDLGCHELILQKGCVPREVEEINESVASLITAIEGAQDERKSAAAEELQNKLTVFGKLVHEINEEIDHLFSEILTSRNEVIDCLRITNQQQQQKLI